MNIIFVFIAKKSFEKYILVIFTVMKMNTISQHWVDFFMHAGLSCEEGEC